MKKILATARDVGAAHQIVEVVRYLRAESEWEVALYASDPAAQTFEAHGEAFTRFDPITPYQASISNEDLAALKLGARRLVETEKPDMVLCGLSNYAYGIDDAVIQAAGAAARSCPSLLLLDDKGPLQSLDDGQPDHLLATSEAIALWAEDSCRSRVHRIGTPKHDALSRLPVDRIRRDERAKRAVRDEDILLVYFAQSSHVPGHDRNFASFVRTLSEIAETVPPYRLILRGHPGFQATANAYLAQAETAGLNVVLDSAGDVTPLLCAADIIVTCTSTVVQDYTWLARAGSDLNAMLVHLLIGDDLHIWLVDTFGDWQPAAVRQGLAQAIVSCKELRRLLLTELAATARKKHPPPAVTPEIDDPRSAILTALHTILAEHSAGSPQPLGATVRP
jgi:hypothetical protein